LKAKKIRVALLFGGRSAEHEISLISARAIYKHLDKKKYRVVSFYINKKGKWRIVSSPRLSRPNLEDGRFFSFLPWSAQDLDRTVGADIYFPVLHGPYGEDGTIQGLLEMADVPYVGAGVMSSAVGMDKAVMKTIFGAHGLPQVKFLVLLEPEWRKNKAAVLARIRREFPLPFFVKPSNLGSSIGITKVKDYARASAALREAFRFDPKILIEQGIQGRELECSVLGNDEPRVTLPGELVPFREFYDYRDKYLDGKTGFRVPAKLPVKIRREIQRIALAAYRAIDCSGMARIDFFLEAKTSRIYLSEINTIPGFTEISMYPKLWEVSGLSFSRLIEALINLGLRRHRAKKRAGERYCP
jgi:D-alanine-D-alanine ligase